MAPIICSVDCQRGRRSNQYQGAPSGVTLLGSPGEVAFSAVPLDEPIHDRTSRHEAKCRLLGLLWTQVRTLQSRMSGPAEWDDATPVIHMVNDSLGRTLLMVEGRPGPSISFASVDGTMWGAVSLNGSSVGIDVAWSGEFGPGYPIRRVFHQGELDFGRAWTGGNGQEAAALLWSVKEAAVKALGCGFHLVDPLHLAVTPFEENGGDSALAVVLTNGAWRRLGFIEGRPIPVRAVREGGVWLSVAVVSLPQPERSPIGGSVRTNRGVT